ncbi:MAG TPA: AAA family ATPase [Devosiaceae bacterium]|jgi:energy-coupling factor transporter ATP-binding protein EcfA2|nr:AAA family ATPase [Devosiaceae bacterium]
MKFSAIELVHWRQFKQVSITFSDSVTILTGRNGTGKTTILNILAQHSKYFSTMIASPSQGRDELGRFVSGLWDDFIRSGTDQVGAITYSTGENSEIRVPQNVSASFSPKIVPAVAVPVLYIPSHRRLATYKRVETIPTEPVTDDNALDRYQSEFG